MKVRELVGWCGEENVNNYLVYLFEYATEEASFLQLRAQCSSEEEYRTSFNILYKASRQEGINYMHDLIKDLRFKN